LIDLRNVQFEYSFVAEKRGCMRKFVSLAGLTILAGVALANPTSAATFTSDHCDPLCGPQPTGFATITGSQVDADTVSVTIHLLNGNSLQGGVNGLTTFSFNNTTNTAITFDFGALNSLFDVSNSMTNTASPGSIHQDGFGTFEYGFNYIPPGGSDPFTQDLTFTLSGTGLTLASFNELSTGGDVQAYLALDIMSGQGNVGQTGVVDCCSPGVTPFQENPPGVPLPGTVWLFAGGLGLLGMLYRKKEKPKSAWA